MASPSPQPHSHAVRRTLNVLLVIGLLDFLLLLVLLYVAFVDRNEGAISILGPIHGIGFLALLVLSGEGAMRKLWGWWFPALVLITGGPIGSLIGELRLRKRF